MSPQTKKTILVVEDEALLLQALMDKFETEGFQVFGAPDGQAGLDAAFKEHPDLILLDIVMPRMDGLTMLKYLRQNDWGKTAQVIVLTNLSDWQKINEAVQHRAFDYLVKTDWKIEDVVKRAKEKLGMS